MAEFADIMKKYKTMCDYCGTCRNGCPLESLANKYNITCVGLLRRHPEEAEKAIMAWEKPIDWSKVEVDTKILVRSSEKNYWVKRYFAKFEDGKVYAWNGGVSSFTTPSVNYISAWNCAKLAEEGDKNE